MKKILLALAVLAVATASAFATDGVNIQWNNGWGVYTHDATDLTGVDDYLLDSYSITWQLIYSIDNTADAPSLANSGNGWVSGDDTVWATRTLDQSIGGANVIDSNGSEWYNYLVWTGSGSGINYSDTGWTTAGYVYQRVYEGSVQAGTWYFDSTPVALVINPPTQQTSLLDGGVGIQPDQQVIPEPATMALLGLGALTLAIRRRRA